MKLLFLKMSDFDEFGGPFQKAKGAQRAKIHTFGYRNFGIFALGAVPRSSALCLFVFVFIFNVTMIITVGWQFSFDMSMSIVGREWRGVNEPSVRMDMRNVCCCCCCHSQNRKGSEHLAYHVVTCNI